MINYRFGRSEVVTAAGTESGCPVLLLNHAGNFDGLPDKEALTAHPETIKLVFTNADGALVLPMRVMEAVEATAKALGIDAEQLRLPIVALEDHQRRVQDLLESNNQLLYRARAAEARVKELEARPAPKSFLE